MPEPESRIARHAGGYGDAESRVLVAVAALYWRDGRVTVRAVAELADLGLATTHSCLAGLKLCGLVDWEEGRKGSLRPRVEIVACNP